MVLLLILLEIVLFFKLIMSFGEGGIIFFKVVCFFLVLFEIVKNGVMSNDVISVV